MATKDGSRATLETRQLLLDAQYGLITEAIEQLKDVSRIDVNYDDPATGFTMLHYAAQWGSRPLVRALAATGQCDFLKRDHQGRTAASLAVTIADDPVLGRYLYDREYVQARAEGRSLYHDARANMPAKTD